MGTQLVETNQISAARIAKTKAIIHGFREDEGQWLRLRDRLLMVGHAIGRDLCEYKAVIPHGGWEIWVTSNFKELGGTDETILTNAQRAMAIYNRNPDATCLSELTSESTRKYMWGYNTTKPRLALDGDAKDAPLQNCLTFVNNFSKWDRQIAIGQTQLPPMETLRHELENTIRRIIALCGSDWVRSLL